MDAADARVSLIAQDYATISFDADAPPDDARQAANLHFRYLAGDIWLTEAQQKSEPPRWQDIPLITWAGKAIVSYNIQKLIRYRVFQLKGTAFDFKRKSLWGQFVLLAGIFAGMMVYGASIGQPNKPVYEGSWLNNARFSLTLLNTLVIFLLGFATNVYNNRWWQMRLHLAEVQRSCLGFSLLLATYLPDYDAAQYRADLLRYSHLAHALAYKAISKVRNVDDLIEYGYIQGPLEAALLTRSPNRVVCVIHWIMVKLTMAALEEKMIFPEVGRAVLERFAMQLGSSTRTVLDYTETQQPFMYIHLLTVIVKFMLVASALLLGSDAGLSWAAGSGLGYGVMAFCVLFILNALYQGLLHLMALMENPFRNNPVQFPRAAEALQRNSAALILQANDLPFPGVASLPPEKRFLHRHPFPPSLQNLLSDPKGRAELIQLS